MRIIEIAEKHPRTELGSVRGCFSEILPFCHNAVNIVPEITICCRLGFAIVVAGSIWKVVVAVTVNADLSPFT